MNCNPPLIFTEFAKGTAQERSDIVISLKKKKEYAQSLTQEAWYTWRENLMEPLSLSLIENVDRLKRDLKYATQISDDYQEEEAELDAELEEIEQEMAQLSAEYDRLKRDNNLSRVSQLEKTQDAELCAMNHDMVTKRIQLDESEHHITSESVTLNTLKEINQTAKQSQYDLTSSILTIQLQLDQHTATDPLEVDQFISMYFKCKFQTYNKTLLENFELSEAVNGWNITRVKTDQLKLSFNDSVDISFQKNGGDSWSSTADIKPTILMSITDQQIIQGFLNKTLRKYAECMVSDWMKVDIIIHFIIDSRFYNTSPCS